jgi:hypothetical protein
LTVPIDLLRARQGQQQVERPVETLNRQPRCRAVRGGVGRNGRRRQHLAGIGWFC